MSTLPAHLLDRRFRIMRRVVWLASGFVSCGFFRTQIIGHEKYDVQSKTNRLRPITLPAPRGLILDRHGRVIAENVPGYTVSLLPAPEPELREALQRLALYIHLDSAGIDRVLQRHRQTPYHPALVLADAPFPVVSTLEERRLSLPGLVIQTE